jgi:hypothetical protein
MAEFECALGDSCAGEEAFNAASVSRGARIGDDERRIADLYTSGGAVTGASRWVQPPGSGPPTDVGHTPCAWAFRI